MSDEQLSDDQIEERRLELLDSWEQAAPGWGRQAERMQAAALPVSAWLLEHARLESGMRVLELAAGPGDTGFMAAAQIAPGGALICSDGVEKMLDVARQRAQELDVQNVEFKQLQLEWIDLPTADVDVVLCRWGVMLTMDPAAAVRECRRVLKPGGQLCLAVWSLREHNPWVTLCETATVQLGLAQPQAPGGAGMFSLSADGAIAELLEDAGFVEPIVDTVEITQRYAGVNDYIGQMRDLSRFFGGIWNGLEDGDRQRLRDTLTELTQPHADAGGTISLPGRSLVACAGA